MWKAKVRESPLEWLIKWIKGRLWNCHRSLNLEHGPADANAAGKDGLKNISELQIIIFEYVDLLDSKKGRKRRIGL